MPYNHMFEMSDVVHIVRCPIVKSDGILLF